MVRDVVKMKDIQFEKGLFENWMTGKIMDVEIRLFNKFLSLPDLYSLNIFLCIH